MSKNQLMVENPLSEPNTIELKNYGSKLDQELFFDLSDNYLYQFHFIFEFVLFLNCSSKD